MHTLRAQRGVTVVELVVAVSLASIVAVMVYFSWSAVNSHTQKRSRRTILTSETMRLARSLASQIRRSPEVTGCSAASLSFLSHATGDTLVWEFDGERLYRNGSPVALASQSARLAEFDIRVVEEGAGPQGPAVLLEIMVEVKDDFGNQVRVPTQVAVNKPPGTEEAEAGWNF